MPDDFTEVLVAQIVLIAILTVMGLCWRSGWKAAARFYESMLRDVERWREIDRQSHQQVVRAYQETIRRLEQRIDPADWWKEEDTHDA